MKYYLSKLGYFLLTVWAAITLNFLIPRLQPGDPAEIMVRKLQSQNGTRRWIPRRCRRCGRCSAPRTAACGASTGPTSASCSRATSGSRTPTSPSR